MDVIILSAGPGVQESKSIPARYIGPYKIAHWVRKSGYSCQVIDFLTYFTKSSINAMVRKFITPETSIIAISTTFIAIRPYPWPNGAFTRLYYELYLVLKEIKEEFPYIKFVVGGYASERMHSFDIFDCTIMNYLSASEDIFVEYLEHLKTGSLPPQGKLHIPEFTKNLALKDKARMWYDKANNPKYNIEVDDFKFMPQDAILSGEVLPLDISRGCIFACRFCQYPHIGKKKLDYIRGMDYIEQELRWNYEQFNTKLYWILDDTFNDTPDKIQAFHAMTQRLPFKIEYFSYLRADLIHRFPDTAPLLQESGLWAPFFGLESLHPEASKMVGKAWSGKHAREYVPQLYHDVWGGKMALHINFLVGLPDEDKTHLKETLQWHKDNNLNSTHFVALGLYGSSNDHSNFSLTSEFDRNSEKYGFTFEQGIRSSWGGNNGWRNKTWTEAEAIDTALELNDEILNSGSPMGAWHTMGLKFQGFTNQYLLKTGRKDLLWPMIQNTTQKFLNNYYNRLLSL
jgi:hypothetical protein